MATQPTTTVLSIAPGRTRALDRVGEYLPAVVVFAVALGGWEALVWALRIQFYLLPAPHVIVTTLRENYSLLIEAGLYTFREALLGFLVGCSLGWISATAASRWSSAQDLLLPYAVASNSVPIIALAPLAIVWFGADLGSKVGIVALMTFFPTFIATLRGLLSAPPAAGELLRSYAATGSQVLWKLRTPASLSYTFSALKVCTTLAMIGAVVSEFFGGRAKSLGVYIKSQAALFHTREAWSAILVACVLGIAFYLVVVVVERFIIPWHVAVRGQ